MNNIEENEVKIRKVFISYSWSSHDYKDRVRELAEELANNLMDVELDQWSLKEGDDSFHYMEMMVKDTTIDKVILLLDEKYKQKADDRKGGVGTETTIMTPKIYANVVKERGKQKFIPVVMERNSETNEAFIPTFLDGRKYIDLTDSNHYEEKFEELVRAIHDKPLYKKPKPGKPPSYLLEDEGTNLGTSGRARRAIEFIKNDKPQALNTVKDYFSLIAENLKMFDFPEETKEIGDESIIEKIQEITPVRDEILDVILAIAKYRNESIFYEELHNFFEQLLPYFGYRNEGDSNNQWAADHYKFLSYELFLYTVATMLKFQRFEQLNELTEQGYYSNSYQNNNILLSFLKFDTYSEALQNYNRRQQQNYYSIEAHFINKRANRTDIKFEDIMQSDFLLLIIDKIDATEESSDNYRFNYWYPSTLNLERHRIKPFEVFLRSQSERFFNKFNKCLRNKSKEELKKVIDKIEEDNKERSFKDRIVATTLSGVDFLATRK